MNIYMNHVALTTSSYFDTGKKPSKDADPEDEKTLRDTVQAVLEQIDEKQYASILIEKGVKNIRKYCFAFEGKTVLSDRTVMTRGTKID